MQVSLLSNLFYPVLNFWEHDFPIKSIFHPELTVSPRFSKCISNTDFEEPSRIVLRQDGGNSISKSSFDIMLFDNDDFMSLLCRGDNTLTVERFNGMDIEKINRLPFCDE